MKGVRIFVCVLFLSVSLTSVAQMRLVDGKDSVGEGKRVWQDCTIGMQQSVEPFEFHLSMGSASVGGRHSSAMVYGIMPMLTFRPNNRLTINASVLSAESMSLGSRWSGGGAPRSYAPYRNPRSVAMVAAVSATYKVNDRLWVGASYMRLAGDMASTMLLDPWCHDGGKIALDATAYTAAMRYRIGQNGFIDVHLSIIDDRTGCLDHFLYGGPYGGFGRFPATCFGGRLFDSPFD